jgi:hypothetical protein
MSLATLRNALHPVTTQCRQAVRRALVTIQERVPKQMHLTWSGADDLVAPENHFSGL